MIQRSERSTLLPSCKAQPYLYVLFALFAFALLLVLPATHAAYGTPAGSTVSTGQEAPFGGTATATPSCTPSAGWSIVSSPNYPGAPNNYLNAVSALAPNDVWAVGYWYNSSPAKTLIEHWDGAQWSVITSPNPGTTRNELYGVVAIAPDDVWAVGSYFVVIGQDNVYQTLTLHWNGTAWSQVASPNLGTWNNYLRAVTAISSNDVWAVGSYVASLGAPETVLALHWNGTQWLEMSPGTNPGSSYNILYGVDATSTSDVWSVGYYNTANGADTLTFRWTGSQWNLVPSANGTGRFSRFNAVDAIAPNDAWAVGYNNPDPGGAGNVVLTFIAHWNGAQWTQVPSPSPGTSSNYLDGVTAIAPNDVWAAGYTKSGSGPIETLVQHWDGSAWTTVTTPNTGTTVNWLTGIDAVSANDVWAAGYSGNASTLTLHYTNTSCQTATPVATSTNTATRTVTSTSTSTATGPTNTATAAPASPTTSSTAIVTASATPVASATLPGNTAIPTATIRATETATTTATSSATSTATTEVIATPTACTLQFTDVPPESAFYTFIRCLACRGIVSGYDDGTFRPGNDITRGQIAKIVSNAANFEDDVFGRQTFADVPDSGTFWLWIERLSAHGVMGGYDCGGPGEPCDADNRPYFRPFANATRGQLSKIVSNAAGLSGMPTDQFYTDVPNEHTFYLWIMRLTELGVMSGYDCGGHGEPCDSENRPYFRPFNNVTRGQASKIVANTFLPGCQVR